MNKVATAVAAGALLAVLTGAAMAQSPVNNGQHTGWYHGQFYGNKTHSESYSDRGLGKHYYQTGARAQRNAAKSEAEGHYKVAARQEQRADQFKNHAKVVFENRADLHQNGKR